MFKGFQTFRLIDQYSVGSASILLDPANMLFDRVTKNFCYSKTFRRNSCA
jgi:hypothetical protein